MTNIYSPAECMKHMNVEIHPALLEAWYGADVTREVAAAGAKVTPTSDLFDPALVLWSRNVPATLDSDGGQVSLSNKKKQCDHALYIVPIEDLAPHIASHTLAQHVTGIHEMVARQLTLVLFGVKEFFKSTGRKTSKTNKLISEIVLEMAIADLLVSTKCDTAVANSPNSLALLIAQFTKAIAEAPHKEAKRACEAEAEFYMKGNNKKCLALDKEGHGTGRIWQQMVAILPMSSLEVSRAICAQYKSPKEFYEACASLNAVNDIADIGVERAGVPGSKARRVGPEFARKLHTLFTAEDGSVLVD